MGFEPTTPTLARLCSTPELHPHGASRYAAPRALYAPSSPDTQQARGRRAEAAGGASAAGDAAKRRRLCDKPPSFRGRRLGLTERGRSSGVEHNLAKVGVVSSNLIARSKYDRRINLIELAAERRPPRAPSTSGKVGGAMSLSDELVRRPDGTPRAGDRTMRPRVSGRPVQNGEKSARPIGVRDL